MNKVFIGTRNIASQIQDWKKGFESLGMEVLSAAPDIGVAKVKNEVDIDLVKHYTWSFRGVRPFRLQRYLTHSRIGFRHRLLKRCLNECDLFVFLWNSIFDDFSDLEVLKDAGKKIVFLFVGSDVRWYYAMKQDFARYGIPPLEHGDHYSYRVKALRGRLRRMRTAEKYADLIMSVPNQSQLALRPYHQAFAIVDPEIIPHNPRQREKPLVVHAPSDSTFKGSRHIMPVLERLQNELGFELRYVRDMAYHEALRLYADADILVGQALCPTAGKQEREALAAGTVVLSSMYYDYPDKNPEECPIIDINPSTLEGELRRIINDLERRKTLAEKGLPYVMKYHTPEFNAERILKLLENTGTYDFYPQFYRDTFIPESDEALTQYNEWNGTVVQCDWYKKHIRPGEREGLIF